MSASVTVNIADEVVALLNSASGGTFTPTFTATRRYAPYLTLASLATLAVSVVPTSKDQTFSSREHIDADHDIKIYVQKLLAKAQDPAEIDPLTLFAETIGDYLASDDGSGTSRRLLATSNASLTKLSGPVLFVKELLEQQEFSAVITATYTTQRTFR